MDFWHQLFSAYDPRKLTFLDLMVYGSFWIDEPRDSEYRYTYISTQFEFLLTDILLTALYKSSSSRRLGQNSSCIVPNPSCHNLQEMFVKHVQSNLSYVTFKGGKKKGYIRQEVAEYRLNLHKYLSIWIWKS